MQVRLLLLLLLCCCLVSTATARAVVRHWRLGEHRRQQHRARHGPWLALAVCLSVCLLVLGLCGVCVLCVVWREHC